MKKALMIISVSITVVLLTLLGQKTVTSVFGQIPEEAPANKENARFVGTWHLSFENDYDVINAAYPDVYAFGDDLVIRPDGRISWHIGAAGAAGTYDVYDNQLKAIVSDIMEFDEYHVGITQKEDGRLVMKYKSVPLEWVYSSEEY